jgi:hypothetical protein
VSDVPKTKGIAVREMLRWYAQQRSPEELRRALMDVAPEHRSSFDADLEAVGVLASNWYDTAAVNALLDVLVATFPPGERAAAIHTATHHAMRTSMSGIYRFVLERLSPESYVRNIQRLWNVLHDTGKREIVMTSPESCISIWRDWPGHGENLCQVNVDAMSAMLELMGCRRVTGIRVACISRGAPECVGEYSWRR